MSAWQERAERAEAAADRLAEVLDALSRSFACDPRDWAVSSRDAWRYGVVCGWGDTDDPECDALPEIASMYPLIDIERMEHLHAARAFHASTVAQR